MAISLVGTIGAATLGASGAAVTPAWGTSETRIAGNLLICWVTTTGSATLPTTPSGWTIAKQVAGTSTTATIYFKRAAGTDSAPTIALITSTFIAAQLAEFSGVSVGTAADQSSSATGTTSPIVATNAAVDTLVGALALGAAADWYTAAATKTLTHTINNATATETKNASTSTRNHYDHTYGVTTTKASATSDSYAFTTTAITGSALVLADFKPAPQPVAQANADIKVLNNKGFSQANADIKDTNFNVFAQANADIKDTNFNVFAQANTRIAILNINVFAQTNALVVKTSNFAQANADIKQTYPSISYRNTIMALGPSGYYRLGESTGATTIIDETGNNNGSYTGSPTFGLQGPIKADSSTAIQLSSGNNGTLTNGYDLSIGNTGTFLFWIKPGSWVSDAIIVEKDDGSGIQWRISRSGTSGSQVAFNDGQGFITANNTFSMDVNAWTFIAITFTSSVLTTHYINGTFNRSFAGSPHALLSSQASSTVYLGRMANSGQEWTGQIAELAIFNRVLTAAEISLVSQVGLGTNISYPIGQAQAKINAFNVNKSAQSNVDIIATSSAFAQASFLIKPVNKVAQAQTQIANPRSQFSQAQADIKVIGNQVWAQAQIDVKKTKTNASAQALARIYAFNVSRVAQAQTILNQRSKTGNAIAFIPGTYNVVNDTFTRSVGAGGLGTNDTGDTWVIGSGTASQWSVDGSKAVFTSSTTARSIADAPNTFIMSPGQTIIQTDFTVHSIGAGTGNAIIEIDLGGQVSSFAGGIGGLVTIPLSTLVATYSVRNGTTLTFGTISLDTSYTLVVWVNTIAADYGAASVKVRMFQTGADDPTIGWGASRFIPPITTMYGVPSIAVTPGNTSSVFYIDNIATTTNAGWPQWAQAQAAIGQSQYQANALAYVAPTYTSLTDTFTRTTSAGDLGTNDTGDTWNVISSADISQFSVDGTQLVYTPIVNSGAQQSQFSFLKTLILDFTSEIRVSFKISDSPKNSSASFVLYLGISQSAWALGAIDGTVIQVTASRINARLTPDTNFTDTTLANVTEDISDTWFTVVYQRKVSSVDHTEMERMKIFPTVGNENSYGWFLLSDYSSGSISSSYASVPFILIQSLYSQTAPTAIYLDNLSAGYVPWTESGQAQAYIFVGGRPTAQAQVDILVTTNQVAQAQVSITISGSTTVNAWAQTNTDILVTTSTYAQSQADIRVTYNITAQVQSDIKVVGSQVWSQGQSDIKTTTVQVAQAQLDIKTTYSQVAQANAWVKTVAVSVVAQAQTDIKSTSAVIAQANADIKAGNTNSWAQAQADIKTTYPLVAQANADIKTTSYQVAQAQVDIKTTASVFAQANARIKGTNISAYAQTNSDIKTTANVFAQNQADIKSTTNIVAQAQVDIKVTTNAFAQVNTDIRVSVNVFAQSQADIKVMSAIYAQAQADIRFMSSVFAQVQAKINAFNVNQVAQSNTDIKTVGRTFAQAQAKINAFNVNQGAQVNIDIKATSLTYAQGQADIKVTSNIVAQGQTDIKAISNAVAQVQTNIKVTSNVVSQAQSDIKITSSAVAQTQAKINTFNINQVAQSQIDIKVTSNVVAQSQTDIKSTLSVVAQSQADIKSTSNVVAQVQTNVKVTSTVVAQAQADIKTTSSIVAQANARIKGIGINNIAQAQSDIKVIFSAVAQGQVDIKVTSSIFAQGQTDIKVTSNVIAQAQSDIKATSSQVSQAQTKINAFNVNQVAQAQAWIGGRSLAVAQAQTKINAFNVNQVAQSNTNIKVTSRVYAQTNADIKVTSSVVAQGQADIKATSTAFAQSQADIKATSRQVAQTNSDIKVTSNQVSQAQVDLRVTSNTFAQVQSDIRVTSRVFGQSQTDIKTTSSVFAQAVADIDARNTNVFAQVNSDIRSISRQSAQANTDIKVANNSAVSQAQVDIKVTSSQAAQANADIKSTYPNIASQGTYSTAVEALSPIAYWRLGETSGTVATDEMGYANLNYINAPTLGQTGVLTGDSGKSFVSTGNGVTFKYASLGSNNFGGPSSWSVMLWLDGGTFNSVNFYDLISRGGWGIIGTWDLYYYGVSKTFTFAVQDNGLVQRGASIAVNNSTSGRHMVVGVYDGSAQTVKVYVDGTASSPTNITNNSGIIMPSTATYVGYKSYSDVKQQEAAIFTRALSATEIKNLYQIGIGVNGSNFGQAQADIKVSSKQFAQAQADIITDIITSSQGYAQAQTDVKVTSQGYSQSQASVKAVSVASGQAQATLRATSFVSAQAQADIRNSYQQYSNAQADIKVTVNNSAQANALIKTNYAQFAQVNADIIATIQKFAQSQASIQVTTSQSAQAQAFISKSAGYAQAQALIAIGATLTIRSLIVTDTTRFTLTLVDRSPIILGTHDSCIQLTLGDSALSMSLSDKPSDTLDLSDHNY